MSSPISLISLIDEHMYSIQQSSERDNTKFHPSSIGSCVRQIVYSMLECETSPHEPRLMRIFECGHSMHDRFERWFGEMGIQIVPELVLDEHSSVDTIAEKCRTLNISGRTDSVIIYNDKFYLVELKSANSNMFKYQLKQPKEQHLWQLQVYMYLTNIHEGFLLYEDKNTQELKEFYIRYDPKLVSMLLDRIKFVNEHVANRTLPAREGEDSTWMCKYCNYNDACQATDDNQGLVASGRVRIENPP